MNASKSEPRDAALVRAVLAGNAGAFDALVERYLGMIYLVGYARLANREAAEDLAQEVFLRAYLNLGSLVPPRRFAAWITRIARNLAIDWLRRDQRVSRLVRLVPIDQLPAGIADERTKGAREIVRDAERHKAVQAAIMELPPEQRELVLLHYIEGLSKKEIARRAALHPSTVGRRLDRALAAMRGALEPVLRELAPAMKAPRRVAARTTALVVAVSAMSAAKHAALANAAARAANLTSDSLAQCGSTTSIAVSPAIWKALLARVVKGAGAAGIKTKITAAVVAVSLVIGSGFLPTRSGQIARSAVHTATPLEFPLRMKTLPLSADPLSLGFPYLPSLGEYNHQLETARPSAIVDEPESVSPQPLYGILKCGTSKSLGFRLDESTGPGGGYDRLIVDCNGNGDLTDDPMVMATGWIPPDARDGPDRENVVFAPVSLRRGKQAGPWNPTLCLKAHIRRRGERPWGFGTYKVNCLSYLETTVKIGGIQQAIWITDANFNLRLGDTGVAGVHRGADGDSWYFEQGDWIVRDRDESGTCSSYVSLRQVEFLSSVIYFGPDPYTLSFAEDLSALRLEPYKGPTGKLTVPENVRGLTFYRQRPDGSWEHLTLQPEGGKVNVPVGTYYLRTCIVAAEDDEGNMVGGKGWMHTKKPENPIRVEADKTAALVCGPPLVVEIQAATKTERPPDGARRGGAYDVPHLEMDIGVRGVGGEDYWPLMIERFNKQGVATRANLRLKILDEKNKEIASDEIEIGIRHQRSEGKIGLRWFVPTNVLGKKVRIVPEYDLGPIETIGKAAEVQL